MSFSFDTTLDLLARTPGTLGNILDGLPEALVHCNEGPDTWTPFQVIGHLVICEESNFMSRISLVVSGKGDKPFAPVDMQSHLDRFNNMSTHALLAMFSNLRKQNLAQLRSFGLSTEKLLMKGQHIKLGEVTAKQILATWAAHDQAHIVQIARTIARQFKTAAGPFTEFLRILQ